jgi:predicted MFS family arabinose efflux permease
MLLWGFAMMTYDINQLSFRQAVTADRLQGRANASVRFVTWGAALPGALLGGALGGMVGLRATLFFGGVGVLFATLWTLLSPTRKLRRPPAEMPAAEPLAAPPADELGRNDSVAKVVSMHLKA